MSTTKAKPRKKAAKPVKTVPVADTASVYAKFLVADEFRTDSPEGKVTAVGLYPDNVLLCQVAPDAPEPSTELPVALRSLGLLFTFGGGIGEIKVRISIGDKEVSSQSLTLIEGRSINLLMQASPFLVASFGTKTITVLVNEKAHKFQFEVRKNVVHDEPKLVPAFVAA